MCTTLEHEGELMLFRTLFLVVFTIASSLTFAASEHSGDSNGIIRNSFSGEELLLRQTLENNGGFIEISIEGSSVKVESRKFFKLLGSAKNLFKTAVVYKETKRIGSNHFPNEDIDLLIIAPFETVLLPVTIPVQVIKNSNLENDLTLIRKAIFEKEITELKNARFERIKKLVSWLANSKH